MSKPPRHSVKEIAHLRGLSGPMLFAVDSVSTAGKLIVHFVRFETIEFENDETFNATEFKVIHDDNDPRLKHLAGCLNPQT